MDKQQIKRSLFFWIDRLQIRKRERYTITLLLFLFVVLALVNIFRKEKQVPAPENHTQILADFELRSTQIQREKLLEDQKYAGIVVDEQMQKEENTIAATATEPVSINTATISQLTQLPGIGNTYAQRIIEYRETNGDFTSVDELVNVKGIGERTLEKIKPFIKL